MHIRSRQRPRQRPRRKSKNLKFKKSKVILVAMSDKEAQKILEKRLKLYGNKLGTARFSHRKKRISRCDDGYDFGLRHRFSTCDRRASDGGPDIYYVPASLEPGQILLAQNAFSWMGDPQSRALAHSSG